MRGDVRALALTADERALLARLVRAEVERRPTQIGRDVLAMLEQALSAEELRACFAELEDLVPA